MASTYDEPKVRVLGTVASRTLGSVAMCVIKSSGGSDGNQTPESNQTYAGTEPCSQLLG